MKRSGFKRKPNSPFSSLANRGTTLRRSTMKRRVKKPTVADGSKYLAACRGESCYLRVAGICLFASPSVVPCHSNQARHGKGMGIKAAHEFTVPGCHACHAWIDQGPADRAVKFGIWDDAFVRWQSARARKMGITEETECSQ